MKYFQSRIQFLNGERKGQEELKKDLVRRIKMLEYSLKQERYEHSINILHICQRFSAKYQRLKGERKADQQEDEDDNAQGTCFYASYISVTLLLSRRFVCAH